MAAELAAELAAEEAHRLARIEEEKAVAAGTKKAGSNGGGLVSFGMTDKNARPGAGGCGQAMPGAAPKPLKKFNGKSLGMFTVNNYVRRACFAVVDDKQFEYVIMSFIVISSTTMVFEDPKSMEDPGFASILVGVIPGAG